MTAKRNKKKEPLPPVSLGGVVYEDSLPLPWVKYPNLYGTFFVFSESKNGPWYFCECNETPLTNLLEINQRFPPQLNADFRRMAPLDSLHVPDEIAEISKNHSDDPIAAIEFKEKLCHRCNLVQPTRRYCHEMYGGRFDQSFGWYVNQLYLRYGVHPWGVFNYLPEVCPDEIQKHIKNYELVQRRYFKESEKFLRSGGTEDLRQLRKDYNRASRELKNTFINFTRTEFGFRKVGESWVSETMVFKIIQKLLPNLEILRHHRPDWLEGLELDIYIPELRVGIEYQGQQHFKPIEAWGGEAALRALQKRDRKKVDICKDKGVTIIQIYYTHPLTKRFISKQLANVGIQSDLLLAMEAEKQAEEISTGKAKPIPAKKVFKNIQRKHSK